MYSPAFSALFELILSHNARIAPSNKLKNSSKMQVQNCGTYSFNITILSSFSSLSILYNVALVLWHDRDEFISHLHITISPRNITTHRLAAASRAAHGRK